MRATKHSVALHLRRTEPSIHVQYKEALEIEGHVVVASRAGAAA
jgi:hypothetical protein